MGAGRKDLQYLKIVLDIPGCICYTSYMSNAMQKSNEKRLRQLELKQNRLQAKLATLTEGTTKYKNVAKQIESLQAGLSEVYAVMMEVI